MKFGAFVRCESCGVTPSSEREIAYSLVLSDHHFDHRALRKISESMKNGNAHPILPKEQEDVFLYHAREYLAVHGSRTQSEAAETENRKATHGDRERPNPSQEAAKLLKEIGRLLYNDEEQNKLIPAQHRSSITGGVDCDVLPGALGAFGLLPSNPIPTNGPIGQVLYLSRLRTQAGNPIMFHRVRSEEGRLGVVDVYEVLSTDGTVRQTLFLSMYHPRKCKLTPRGYTYAAEFDSSNFTYGVNHIVPSFLEKLDAYIRRWQMEALGIPLPVEIVREAISGSRFHPSVLNGIDRAPRASLQGESRDDILKLLHASRDPRFEGQSIPIGIDGIVRPMAHNQSVETELPPDEVSDRAWANMMNEQPPCKNCDSTGWVCEAHPDRPWEDTPLRCGCGEPGMPCQYCNPCDRDHPPRDMPGFVVHIARADKPSFAEEAPAWLPREAGVDVKARDSDQSTAAKSFQR